MSDSFQAYVFDVKPTAEAQLAAARMVAQLIEAQTIVGEKSDNVLGKDTFGYGPGRRAAAFVIDGDRTWRDTQVNGLQVTVGRVVEENSELDSAKCPECGHVISNGGSFGSVMDAVGEWFDGQDGRLRCPKCERQSDITQWDFDGDMALGTVGMVFWNWPTHLPQLKTAIEQASGFESKMVLGRI